MAAMGARRPLQRVVVGDEPLSVIDTGRAWVVAGGPARVPELAVAQAARAAGRAVVFFGVAPGPSTLAAELPIGQEPVWDLAAWPAVVAGSRTLRSQVRRAHNKGVCIEVPTPADDPAIEALVGRWLRTRTLPPLGFVVDVESARPHQAPGPDDLLLVARAGDQVVGLLVARGLTGGEALVEHVLREHAAPNGTGEALVDHAFRALSRRGFTHATLGLAPLREDAAAPLPRWLHAVRELSRGLFDWRGLDAWKEKLRPTTWRPLVMRAFGVPAVQGIGEVLLAFAHRRPVRFALATVLRGPPLFYRVFGALLVPWMVGLALVDERHFPSAAVRWAWVGFDAVLVVMLFWLAFRVERRVQRVFLHQILAALVGLDAAVTLLQAALWNAPRAVSAGDVAVMGLGCVAPAAVAVVLIASLRHRR